MLRVLGNFCVERLDLLAREQSEVAQVASRVAVVRIDPELKELVRRRANGIQVNGAGFGLSEFCACGSGDERCRDHLGVGTVHAPHELHSGSHVAPLVATTYLERYSVPAVQLQKV